MADSKSTVKKKKDDEEYNGTEEGADRSGQFPGAGDPREAHDNAAGIGEPDANKR